MGFFNHIVVICIFYNYIALVLWSVLSGFGLKKKNVLVKMLIIVS